MPDALQAILYHLSHQASPRILKYVVYPFSSRSSWPRNRTGVSCFAGRFLTSWATRETQLFIYWMLQPSRGVRSAFAHSFLSRGFIYQNIMILGEEADLGDQGVLAWSTSSSFFFFCPVYQQREVIIVQENLLIVIQLLNSRAKIPGLLTQSGVLSTTPVLPTFCAYMILTWHIPIGSGSTQFHHISQNAIPFALTQWRKFLKKLKRIAVTGHNLE